MVALSWFRELFPSKVGKAEGGALSTETFWRAVCRLRQPMLLLQVVGFKVIDVSEEVLDLFPEMTTAEIESALRSAMNPSSKARVALATTSALALKDVRVGLTTKAGPRTVLLDIMPVPEYPGQGIALVTLRAEGSVLPKRLRLWRAILSCVPHPAWILSPSGEVSYSNASFLQWPLSSDEAPLPVLSGARQVLGQLYQEVCQTHWMAETTLNLEDFGNWHVLYFPTGLKGDGFVVAIAFSLDIFNLPGKAMRAEARLDINHVFQAREEERASISREIHDSMGQELTVLKLELRRLANMMKECCELPATAELIRSARAHVDRLAKEARRIAYELRQDTLAFSGLAKAVQALVLDLKTRLELPIQLTVAPRWREPSEGMAHHLYRSVQELLNNVSKHAQASRCMVKMGFEGGMYWLEVRDDGLGIPSTKTESVGLSSLYERARMFGGVVIIKTRPEVEGTLVRIELRERRSEGEGAGAGLNIKLHSPYKKGQFS